MYTLSLMFRGYFHYHFMGILLFPRSFIYIFWLDFPNSSMEPVTIFFLLIGRKEEEVLNILPGLCWRFPEFHSDAYPFM